jgi:hypothetical protein
MEVITIESDSFYKLVTMVVERLKAEHNIKENRWISAADAMEKMGISSKTTLQRYRDEGAIKFTSPGGKIILYDVESIYEFLEKKSHQTF